MIKRQSLKGPLKGPLPGSCQTLRGKTIAVMVCIVALAGCNTSDEAPERPDAGVSTATVPQMDSTLIRSAQIAFRKFLDASREGSATHDNLAELTVCGDESGTMYFPTTLLAGYSLLPFDTHGDTVVARASVVTVAEQDIDRRSSRFTARQRVREDILEWDVIPAEQPGEWVVCNGLRFGYLGADSLTTWRPDGASYTTARALVDSIAQARAN